MPEGSRPLPTIDLKGPLTHTLCHASLTHIHPPHTLPYLTTSIPQVKSRSRGLSIKSRTFVNSEVYKTYHRLLKAYCQRPDNPLSWDDRRASFGKIVGVTIPKGKKVEPMWGLSSTHGDFYVAPPDKDASKKAYASFLAAGGSRGTTVVPEHDRHQTKMQRQVEAKRNEAANCLLSFGDWGAAPQPPQAPVQQQVAPAMPSTTMGSVPNGGPAPPMQALIETAAAIPDVQGGGTV